MNLINISNRRGVHGKFSLPIRSQNDDNNCSGNESNGYQNRNNSNQQQTNQQTNQSNQNIDMSNMKNIDQKLIEIIQSEVYSKLFNKREKKYL